MGLACACGLWVLFSSFVYGYLLPFSVCLVCIHACTRSMHVCGHLFCGLLSLPLPTSLTILVLNQVFWIGLRVVVSHVHLSNARPIPPGVLVAWLRRIDLVRRAVVLLLRGLHANLRHELLVRSLRCFAHHHTAHEHVPYAMTVWHGVVVGIRRGQRKVYALDGFGERKNKKERNGNTVSCYKIILDDR